MPLTEAIADHFRKSLDLASETVAELEARHIELGYAPGLAKVIAESFALYQMGYYTAEGCAQAMYQAGATKEQAARLAENYRKVKHGSQASRSG